MDFEALIAGLGDRIGVALVVDSDGACVLSVDGMMVTIQSRQDSDSIGLLGLIGEAPPQNLEALLSAMLNANHLFKGTGGATISRDPDTGDFYLYRIVDLKVVDVDGFCMVVERFLNTLETWCKMLADYRPSEETVRNDDSTSGNGIVSGFMAV